MTCPLICHCSANVCLHREMKKTPGRKKRSTHATRKFDELQKERAKYRDGRGWERALKSKLDAQAREEIREQDRQNERLRQEVRLREFSDLGDAPASRSFQPAEAA